MAGELRKKEQEQTVLEKSIMHLGGRYVEAVEAKEKIIRQTAERQIEWEKDELNFKARVEQMRLDGEALVKNLALMQVASGKDLTGACPHCEHYFEVEGYHSSQINNLNQIVKSCWINSQD
jgi:hypothetical protein